MAPAPGRNAGKVKEVRVDSRRISGTLREPTRGGASRFVTNRVDQPVPDWPAGHGVTGAIEDTFLRNLLSWMLPILFFFALRVFVFRRVAERQGMGGPMSSGKSKARVYMEKEVGMRFDDVAHLLLQRETLLREELPPLHDAATATAATPDPSP